MVTKPHAYLNKTCNKNLHACLSMYDFLLPPHLQGLSIQYLQIFVFYIAYKTSWNITWLWFFKLLLSLHGLIRSWKSCRWTAGKIGASYLEQVINAMRFNLIDNFLNFKLSIFTIFFRYSSKFKSYVFPIIVKFVVRFGFRVLPLFKNCYSLLN